MVPGKDLGWEVKNGLLGTSQEANNLVTDPEVLEFRIACWFFRLGKREQFRPWATGDGMKFKILEDYGKPADIHGMGALYGRKFHRRMQAWRPGRGRRLTCDWLGEQSLVVVTTNA